MLVAGPVALWVGALVLFWNRKCLRFSLLGVAALRVAFLALSGRSGDAASLREEYVRALRRYQGSVYVWGGESRLGIDCSGLVRCGLIDAGFWQGLRTANPRLVREALALWWNDGSARSMKDGYRRQAHVLLEAPGLNALDHSRLLPGDFAITSNGMHALAYLELAYLGDGTWIEADPAVMRVITVRAPSADNLWFDTPVHILRWRQPVASTRRGVTSPEKRPAASTG